MKAMSGCKRYSYWGEVHVKNGMDDCQCFQGKLAARCQGFKAEQVLGQERQAQVVLNLLPDAILQLLIQVLSEPLGVQTGRQAGAEGILTISHVKLYLTTRRG